MDRLLNDKRSAALGVLGALITLYGHSQSHPQLYYILGSFCLLLVAVHYKLVYFVALELILATGHTAVLLGVGLYARVALPILLCIQLLLFYLMLGKKTSIFLLLGIVGIALMSLGFAYNHQWVFFIGSTCIAAYAYYCVYQSKHYNPCIIWAVLNTIFAFFSLYQVIRGFHG